MSKYRCVMDRAVGYWVFYVDRKEQLIKRCTVEQWKMLKDCKIGEETDIHKFILFNSVIIDDFSMDY